MIPSSLLAPFRRQTLRSITIAAVILLAATMIPGAVAIAYDDVPSVTHIYEYEPPAQQQRGESELPWLFAVYAITWAAFFGYVFVMSRRQREMQREIDTLKRALDAKIESQDS